MEGLDGVEARRLHRRPDAEDEAHLFYNRDSGRYLVANRPGWATTRILDGVGYQFRLLQSGQVIYRRASGFSRLEPKPVAMTTRTRQDMGSANSSSRHL